MILSLLVVPTDDLTTQTGIHGLPLLPWPRVGGKNTPNFYCAHNRVTFATWHTPYMLLFEQRLYEEMRELIPDTFAESDHTDMFRAADTWRLPFWDWARRKPTWNPSDQNDPVNNPNPDPQNACIQLKRGSVRDDIPAVSR